MRVMTPRGASRTIVWRPIATAPKDGRMIEVNWIKCHPGHERAGPKRARWVDGAWLADSPGWWPCNPNSWRPMDGSIV